MGTKVPSITLDNIRNLIEMLSLVKIKINIQILHWFLHFLLCKGFFAYVFFYFQRQNIVWIMNKKCSVSKWSIKHSIDPQVSVLPMITLIHCLSNNRLGLACRRGLPAIRHHNNRVITLEVHLKNRGTLKGQFHLPLANACTAICQKHFYIFRAGHAATLPRQRDHAFRPQSSLLVQYYYLWCGYSI